MEILGVFIFFMGVAIIWVCAGDESDIGVALGLGIMIASFIVLGIADSRRKNTPEYKLQQIKNEIDNIHQDSVNYQKDKQKKLWIWKRTKELEDSLIKLR